MTPRSPSSVMSPASLRLKGFAALTTLGELDRRIFGDMWP
jgi:hypothetical protein